MKRKQGDSCPRWKPNFKIKRQYEQDKKRFVNATKEIFETQYLTQPTHIKINKALGFPNVFASLSCMHSWWKICPIVWQGQFQNKDGNKLIILKVVIN
jgi:hypothetical protein